MIEEYINRVETAIYNAMAGNTKLTPTQFNLDGMSSRENKILLNEILKPQDKYLEIGVFKGSTFASALYKNEGVEAYAIDNFSEFGGDGNFNWFKQACDDCEVKNYTFIKEDSFNLSQESKEKLKNINVYFYDGAHEHDHQEKALTYYIDHLADDFILIVDDWNHPPAQTGTASGIEKTKVTIHKTWILKGDYIGSGHANMSKSFGWHNGLYVAVISKNKES